MSEGEKADDNRLEELFCDLEDGIITSEDHARLMRLLRSDQTVRHAFWKHMAFVSAMHHASAFWATDREPARATSGARENRRPATRSVFAAAALVALLISMAWLLIHRELPPASVTATSGSEWTYISGGINTDGDFSPGTRIDLKRGSLRISSRHGSVMLLEGPTLIEIKSPVECDLRSGIGWFTVNPKDKGFTVHSPRVGVVNLGTEFGVMASAGSDQIHVGRGSVRISSKLIDLSRDLEAGQAVASDMDGRIRDIPFRRDLFLKQLGSRPTVYHWSFDDEKSGMVSETDGFRIQMLPEGEPPAIGSGRFGGAVDFSANQACGISDFPGISGAVPRTIAVWLRGLPVPIRKGAQGEILFSTVVGWGRYSHGGEKWQLAVNASGTSVSTQWGGSWVAISLPAGKTVLDGQWHHLASVFTGNEREEGGPEILHYVDGVLQTEGNRHLLGPIYTAAGTEFGLPMVISGDIWPEVPKATYPWTIDELYVARYPFDAEEVRKLYETNQLESE